MKKVTIIAFVLVIIGFGAYIVGSFLVSASLTNNTSTLINKPTDNDGNNVSDTSANTTEDKIAMNTTPTTSITAPIVNNDTSIVSNDTSIANPDGNELSSILGTESPKGYSIKSMQLIGLLTVKPYDLKVYNKPNEKAQYGHMNTNSMNVTITGEYENWYRISIGNYIGFIEKDNVEISQVINAGVGILKCNLIGSVSGIDSNDVLLNVRKSPNIDSDISYRVSNFGHFNIIGATGNWYEIDVQGQIGYVNVDYVGTIAPSLFTNNTTVMDNIMPVNGDITNKEKYILSAEPVNLQMSSTENIPVYKDNSTKSKVIDYLSNNEEFQGISLLGNWIEVSVNNQVGYVFLNGIYF